ncbi:protein PPLZ12 [Sesbania bispinosa]|nr:protein PPLZ12 [Sesbania bispinosa]
MGNTFMLVLRLRCSVERWGGGAVGSLPPSRSALCFHFFNPLAGECLAGILTTRISSLDVKIETKTKDNVFVQLLCSIQYRVVKENADDAFYELQNPQEQIQAYVLMLKGCYLLVNSKEKLTKVLLVNKAEAEAESKYLGGVEGTSAKEVMDLIMITQYFDTSETLGTHQRTPQFLYPMDLATSGILGNKYAMD